MKSEKEIILNQYEDERRRRIEENTWHVEAHNAQLIPEHPGYARVDGPRRQYFQEALSDGTIMSTEI